MRRFIALLCAAVCLFAVRPVLGEDVRALLDAVFEQETTLGASVAVFQNGEITFTHTYGTIAPDGEPVTEDTVFQTASISKMVSNIGLMQLITEKDISLDTDLSELFGFDIRNPAYPSAPVTLRQMMTHTASLKDSGFYNRTVIGNPEPLSYVFGHQEDYRVFYLDQKPGTRREYSNFGGGLVGCLIEKLSGQALGEYMQEHVFSPLGVTAGYHVSCIPEDVPAADIYRMPDLELSCRLRGKREKTPEWNPDRNYTATQGRLIISAPDLAKVLIALCDGGIYRDARVLSESAAAEMITPQDWRGSVNCRTGHGLFMNIYKNAQVEGRLLYGHGGKAYGMLAAAYFDPADRTGVVMLTNGCNDEAGYTGVGRLGRKILTLCYEKLIDPVHEVVNPFTVE